MASPYFHTTDELRVCERRTGRKSDLCFALTAVPIVLERCGAQLTVPAGAPVRVHHVTSYAGKATDSWLTRYLAYNARPGHMCDSDWTAKDEDAKTWTTFCSNDQLTDFSSDRLWGGR